MLGAGERTRMTGSILKEFTIQLLGSNEMATATLRLKIKSEPLEIPLSVDAGMGKKLEETTVRTGTIIGNPAFPPMGRTVSVTRHIQMH